MSREEDLIRKMAACYPKSECQLNNLYESDAEIIEFCGSKFLVNIDEFSIEDHFREHNPFALGWNVAVGSMSDIFASGGKPVFAGHSLVVGKDWSEEFILEFNRGVAAALDRAGATFIGGDFGVSDTWRYTATVLGVPHENAVKRSGANFGDQLYITGEIGRGNMEALLRLMGKEKIPDTTLKGLKSRFPLRSKEAELVSKYASACIDTSDGAYNCINTLAEQSAAGFVIDNLPILETGDVAAKLFNIPPVLLFLAEAGEYELIFTVEQKNEEPFKEECRKENLECHCLGRIADVGTKTARYKNRVYDLAHFSLRARDYDTVEEYIRELINWTEQQVG